MPDGTPEVAGELSYAYDSQNQLIRENDSRLGRTRTWTYDNAGNILSRTTYPYTTGALGTATGVTNYSYEDPDWGDLLTGFSGINLAYDQIGNMVSFGSRTFTWEHGRQLASQAFSDGEVWTYTYNADGMRTGRTNGNISYEYIYNGSQLMQMTRNGVVMDFTYINGIPATISFGDNTFYYIVNGQGDITGITDSNGVIQVSYYYDAWGSSSSIYNPDSSYGLTLATINPLRYRGYVFDWEVGLYYLQSRYYIPDLGRFLNADGLVATGQGILGNNMFAYCGNNPVCRSNPSGYGWIKGLLSALKLAVGCLRFIANISSTQSADYITDQHSAGIGDQRLGLATVSHGGCGVVATYNALVTLGENPSFENVLSYYNDNLGSRLVAQGFAGIMPIGVVSYFNNHGYRVIMTDNWDEIDIYSKIADANILWTVVPYGAMFNAHFIEYHRDGKGYVGYNTPENNGIYSFRWATDYGYMGERYYALGIFIFRN